MATYKQKLVASKLAENHGNVSKTMLQVGYSPNTAKKPSNLTKSKGWEQLMDKFLPDKKLLQVHNELLNNQDWRARDAGLEKAYRIKGKLGNSLKSEQENVSQEIREVIFRIRTMLPDSVV